MESYLTNRRQSVIVNGKQSSEMTIEYGTPQGSRLSPLLFLIIMADLGLWTFDSILSNFSDDTQSVIIEDDVETLKEKTAVESASVLRFFSANNLVNNADKAALLYNSNGKMGSIELQITGKNIKSTNSEKLSGLHVSASFS